MTTNKMIEMDQTIALIALNENAAAREMMVEYNISFADAFDIIKKFNNES